MPGPTEISWDLEFLSKWWIRPSGFALRGILQASLSEKIENVMFSPSEMETWLKTVEQGLGCTELGLLLYLF